METLDIEKLQQELQKLGHERLDPNDPLFMDHLARRLELQWHYEKINALLEKQQTQIEIAQLEFSESLRKAYSEWINEGGNHLKNCIETSGVAISQKLRTEALPPTIQDQWLNVRTLIAYLLSFLAGASFIWILVH